jgi:hypothetical protein
MIREFETGAIKKIYCREREIITPLELSSLFLHDLLYFLQSARLARALLTGETEHSQGTSRHKRWYHD